MEKYKYYPTALEKWISQFYLRRGFLEPGDLDPKYIAREMGIFYTLENRASYAYEEGRFKLINVDGSLPPEKAKEQFFHEWCHILRHAGYQIMMPKAFRELQERDARHFTRYAAIPFHMLKQFDFRDPDIIETLTSSFGVSYNLCKERVNLIFSRAKTFEYYSRTAFNEDKHVREGESHERAYQKAGE